MGWAGASNLCHDDEWSIRVYDRWMRFRTTKNQEILAYTIGFIIGILLFFLLLKLFWQTSFFLIVICIISVCMYIGDHHDFDH